MRNRSCTLSVRSAAQTNLPSGSRTTNLSLPQLASDSYLMAASTALTLTLLSWMMRLSTRSLSMVLKALLRSWWKVSVKVHQKLTMFCSIITVWHELKHDSLSHHLIYPLTMRFVWAPQMILQPVSYIFPCSPLPSGTCRTPGLSIPWCCLPTSSSVHLVFFPLSLCLARWFWPDLMNGKHDHTTAVCVSLQSSGDLRVVQLPTGYWHGLPRW